MPARDQMYQCFCSACSHVDGEGIAQNPGGKLIPLRYQTIHLRNIRSSRDAPPEIRQTAVESLIRRAASENETSGSPGGFRSNDALDTITAELSRMTMLSSPSEPPIIKDPLSKDCNLGAVASILSEKHLLDPSREAKRERNRRTTSAHRLLDSIEKRVQFINRQSLSSCSVEMQRRLCADLKIVEDRLSCVNRRVNSVISRKTSILHTCVELQTRLESGETPLLTDGPVKYDSSYQFNRLIDFCDELPQVSIFLGVIGIALFGISRSAADLFLQIITLILSLTFRITGTSVVVRDRTLEQVPKTISTALSRFNLEGRTTTLVVCPECNCTYKPKNALDQPPSYLPRCTNLDPEDNPCNTLLVHDPNDGCQHPVKSFVYHHFHDYLASLLARPELETLMDKPCDDLMQNVEGPPSSAKDIWDAEFLRTFKGPSDSTLFVDRKGEGRYLFSLNVDFFNIEGNKMRNAKTSCGVISCACLNLPPDIRYKPENMYLAGIIPGPNEPSGDRLNYFLDPLIDDMVESWTRGIQFSRTAHHILQSLIIALLVHPTCTKHPESGTTR